jgi:hypothetical protein
MQLYIPLVHSCRHVNGLVRWSGRSKSVHTKQGAINEITGTQRCAQRPAQARYEPNAPFELIGTTSISLYGDNHSPREVPP